jgi:hypothetical protein
MKAAAVALAAVFATAGCSSFQHSRGDPSALAEPTFVVDVSSRGDMLDSLGPPLRVAAAGDGVAFLYEHVETRETQLGVSLDGLKLPFFKAVVARGSAERDALIAVFDAQGVLRAVARDRWSEELGRGGAVQFLWTALPIADASAFDVSPPAAGWPKELLAELPVGLNRPHSPDSGEAGIEQLATTRRVGQHTLELR